MQCHTLVQGRVAKMQKVVVILFVHTANAHTTGVGTTPSTPQVIEAHLDMMLVPFVSESTMLPPSCAIVTNGNRLQSLPDLAVSPTSAGRLN
jgi:hypothetical protein